MIAIVGNTMTHGEEGNTTKKWGNIKEIIFFYNQADCYKNSTVKVTFYNLSTKNTITINPMCLRYWESQTMQWH